MVMAHVFMGEPYVIVYMDTLGMDVRFHQLDQLQLIHVMVTLFAMAMVLVLRVERYVIVYMDILGMDVKFHHTTTQQQKNQVCIHVSTKF